MSRIKELTTAEVIDAELAAGQSISLLAEEDAPSTAILAGIGWVRARRAEPRLTFEDFTIRTPFKELTRLAFGQPEPVTVAPADAAAAAAAASADAAFPGAVPPSAADAVGDPPAASPAAPDQVGPAAGAVPPEGADVPPAAPGAE